MDLELEQIARAEAVQKWMSGYSSFWSHQTPDAESQRKLEVLGEYCSFSGVTPDELVQSLFRPTPEGPRIKLKRRREVMAQIIEFERAVSQSGTARGRDAGNVVRSFLIHNGVALTASPVW